MKKNKTVLESDAGRIPMLITVAGCKKFLDRKPLTATLDDLNQGALEGTGFGYLLYPQTYAGFSTLPWMDFHSIRDDDAQKGSSTNRWRRN